MNIKVYDNGGAEIMDGFGSFDRYTVVYLDNGYRCPITGRQLYESVGMSANPFHPQGFCQHGECVDGNHLGVEIKFEDLPKDCRSQVLCELVLSDRHTAEPDLYRCL